MGEVAVAAVGEVETVAVVGEAETVAVVGISIGVRVSASGGGGVVGGGGCDVVVDQGVVDQAVVGTKFG